MFSTIVENFFPIGRKESVSTHHGPRGNPMKFYLLSDNVDTQVGMRLTGIEGSVIHEREAMLKALEACIDDESIGIVLMTTKLVELAPEVISELKLNLTRPLIVEIPDRHGSSNVGEAINQYVSEAIGVDM